VGKATGRTIVILGYFKKPFFALISGRTKENRCPFTSYGCKGFLTGLEQDGLYSEYDPMAVKCICSVCSNMWMGSVRAKRVPTPTEVSIWKVRQMSYGTKLKIKLNKTETDIVAAIRAGKISIG
jgi:hypothetical protein